MKLIYETRPAYAFMAVSGTVDVAEAATLREAAATQARTHETMRLMLDLRDAEITREARDAILGWARAPHASATAMVTLDELFVAEVNMAALASGARVRGFPGSSDAHRWLTRGSMAKTPFDGGSTRPPPVDAATRRAALMGRSGFGSSSTLPAVRTSDRPSGSPERSAHSSSTSERESPERSAHSSSTSERASPERSAHSSSTTERVLHGTTSEAPTSQRPTTERPTPRIGSLRPPKR